jgi:hypothetical protein
MLSRNHDLLPLIIWTECTFRRSIPDRRPLSSYLLLGIGKYILLCDSFGRINFIMRFLLVHIFVFSLFLTVCSSTLSDLKSSFQNPPRSSGTGTYYQFMNGWASCRIPFVNLLLRDCPTLQITKAGITADLEAFVKLGHTRVMALEAGLGLPEGPIAFASDDWYDALAWLCEEGERVGIDVVLYSTFHDRTHFFCASIHPK